MEKNANYALVGIATMVLFAGLIIFIIWLARFSLNREYDYYDVVFQGPVRGISEGGEVHFNGIKVGDVTRIAIEVSSEFTVKSSRLTDQERLFFDIHGARPELARTGLHTIAVGGVAPHVTELAAGLARRGNEVTYAA